MTKPPCPKCNRTHPSTASIAEGRFRHGPPTGYRAFGDPDMPLRNTREEADQDACAVWARETSR